MDTTSSALARVLQLLSIHPDAQEKLRAEICDAQKDGQLTYDQLVSLPYLDAVCRETLRLYVLHTLLICSLELICKILGFRQSTCPLSACMWFLTLFFLHYFDGIEVRREIP